MRNQHISLSIKSPCSENWNSMTTTGQGKYCDKCARQVIDFASMTDQQILNYLRHKEGRICSRLTSNQMNRTLVGQHSSSGLSGFLKFLVSGLFLTQAEMAASQSHVVYRYEKTFRRDDGIQPAQPDTLDRPVPIDSTKNLIKGVVIDAQSSEPLIFANVFIEKPLIGVQTDLDGKFELKIPEELRGDSITLCFSYTGYVNKKMIISKTDFYQKQNIRITMEGGIFLGEIGVIAERYPWWKFWKRIRF